MNKTFETLSLSSPWTEAIGNPEPSGTWFIYGMPKNGKTTFALMLAHELAPFRSILYNSIEEGLSLSIRNAIIRAHLDDLHSGFRLTRLPVDEMKDFLRKRSRTGIIFLDSIQFAEITFRQYKTLKELFPQKLFIYISHMSGNRPEGDVARRIWRDASVIFRIEGFRAFPTSRYGGGTSIDIHPERAARYWNNSIQTPHPGVSTINH
jgi:hypothetical protein